MMAARTVMGQHGFARSMTPRARWYLIIAATRHLLTAGFAIFFAESFRSTSFGPLIDAAPLWMWGVMFAGAGIACAIGAAKRSARIARLGLMLSATSTLMLAAGICVAIFTGELSAPTGPIIYLAVAFKDFTVCADPLRSPFEDWVDEIVTGEPDAGRT